jgi:hypothetical protein
MVFQLVVAMLAVGLILGFVGAGDPALSFRS